MTINDKVYSEFYGLGTVVAEHSDGAITVKFEDFTNERFSIDEQESLQIVEQAI